jgi:hypothetical protein
MREKKMKKHVLVVITAILVFAMVTGAMAADPFVGTWKLNVAKSRAGSTGTLSTQSSLFKIEAWGDGQKLTGKWITSEGKAGHWEWTARYDGKDYPVTGDPGTDAVALKKSNPNTLENVEKKAGKEVGRVKCVVSKDGKTMTVTGKEKDAQGRDVAIVEIYDRQ